MGDKGFLRPDWLQPQRRLPPYYFQHVKPPPMPKRRRKEEPMEVDTNVEGPHPLQFGRSYISPKPEEPNENCCWFCGCRGHCRSHLQGYSHPLTLKIPPQLDFNAALDKARRRYGERTE